MSFAVLPNELVLRILSFLKHYPDLTFRAALVCRRFRLLCLDPTLWRRVQIPSPYQNYFVHFDAIVRLVQRCTLMEEISYKALGNRFFEMALRQCPDTVTKIKINLALPKLSDSRCGRQSEEFLQILGQFGTSVRTLDIGRDDEYQWYSYSTILVSNAACLKNLTSLSLLGQIICQGGDLLKAIGANCKRLKICNLPRLCANINDELDALTDGIKETLEELDIFVAFCSVKSVRNISKCARRNKLRLRHWPLKVGRDGSGGIGGGGDVLLAIFEQTKLRSLSICRPGGFEARDLVVAFSGGKQLSSLERMELLGTVMDDPGLEAIADSCKELRYLDIFSEDTKITSGGLRKLLSTCGSLRELRLGHLVADTPPPGGGTSFLEAFRDAKAPLVRLVLGEGQVSEDALVALRRLMPGLVIETSPWDALNFI